MFGDHCREALQVSRCESGLSTTAQNGQYLGLFQMGSSERRLFDVHVGAGDVGAQVEKGIDRGTRKAGALARLEAKPPHASAPAGGSGRGPDTSPSVACL